MMSRSTRSVRRLLMWSMRVLAVLGTLPWVLLNLGVVLAVALPGLMFLPVIVMFRRELRQAIRRARTRRGRLRLPAATVEAEFARIVAREFGEGGAPEKRPVLTALR